MKFFLSVILIIVLGFLAGLFSPWWSIAVVSFLTTILIRQSLGKSFFAGFLGIFILWVGVSWWIDLKNESILSHKIAKMFYLDGSSILLILITGLLGGIVAGFAGMAGASIHPKKKAQGLHPS
jgi:hypothetical protein